MDCFLVGDELRAAQEVFREIEDVVEGLHSSFIRKFDFLMKNTKTVMVSERATK